MKHIDGVSYGQRKARKWGTLHAKRLTLPARTFEEKAKIESAPRETDSQGPTKVGAKPKNGERSRRNGATLLALTFENNWKLRAFHAKRTHRVSQGR